MKNKIIKGFKGFHKNMKCRDFQYEENKKYEIKDDPVLCSKGFHFCENPLDVLDYYNLCDSEFSEVESLGKTRTDETKTVTNKIKIGLKLNLKKFIKLSVDFLLEKCNPKKTNSSKLASSGYYSQLASSGYSSQLASSGDYSKLASSGYSSQLASSGYYSKLASSGDSSKLASSGYSSKLASSGDYSKLASSGDYSQLASSGDSSKLASSGDYSQLASSGDYSIVVGIGINNMAKGQKGNWIVLAEWTYDDKKSKWISKYVKSQKIDGKKLKADTWYKLEKGKFIEVKRKHSSK